MFGLKGMQGKEDPRCGGCLLQFSAAHGGGLGSLFTWPGREKSPAHPTALPFQRARQMDEELSRRGSPIPKKVGWFSSQEIVCFGKPGPHSWPFPQCECMEVHRQLF